MVYEVSKEHYRKLFIRETNPFISIPFIELNSWKVDYLVFLADNIESASIGLIGGVKNGVLRSPFSAPSGGFHYSHDGIYYYKIFNFIKDLRLYLKEKGLNRIELQLAPEVYCPSFTAKVVNALCQSEFMILPPEISSLVDLNRFTGQFLDSAHRNYFRQAVRNGLRFIEAKNLSEKEEAYEIIKRNREWLNRPLWMSFNDLMDVSRLWQVDFFIVVNRQEENIAAAVFYRGHSKIIQGVFWGDNEIGRSLRAIDFISNNIWNYYKDLGYDYIDIGISSEDGVPNSSLLRFKERIDSVSTLRFRFLLQLGD